MSTERWLRVNTCWSDSGWLYEQSPGVRLAWIELLCYIKRDGIKGRAKALSVSVASSKWRIPKEDIVTLLSVSVTDVALQIDDGDWVVSNWSKYQGESNERVQRFREKKEAKKTETLTETETETETGGVTPVTSVTLHNVTLSPLNPPKGGKRNVVAHDSYSDLFEQFWKRFPNNAGKGAAFAAWEKHDCSKIFDKIMAAVDVWLKWRNDNKTLGVFTPEPCNASTWLNQSRWDDTYSTPDIHVPQRTRKSSIPTTTDESYLRQLKELGYD